MGILEIRSLQGGFWYSRGTHNATDTVAERTFTDQVREYRFENEGDGMVLTARKRLIHETLNMGNRGIIRYFLTLRRECTRVNGRDEYVHAAPDPLVVGRWYSMFERMPYVHRRQVEDLET